jgi:5-methylcytosine-specific restriction enzyme A
MRKLTTLRPRLSVLRSRISAPTPQVLRRDHDERRDSAQPWRACYKTARWQALRWSILVRDHFTCQRTECRRSESDTSQLVCDHIEPHRGDWERFWKGPFQTLCKRCHDSEKQREEQADRMASRAFD